MPACGSALPSLYLPLTLPLPHSAIPQPEGPKPTTRGEKSRGGKEQGDSIVGCLFPQVSRELPLLLGVLDVMHRHCFGCWDLGRGPGSAVKFARPVEHLGLKVRLPGSGGQFLIFLGAEKERR